MTLLTKKCTIFYMDGKCHYRRPQTSVRGKFSFHYSNDHKMLAYCSFFNILVSSPPAAGLIFCTILAKLLAVRINLLWILFALGLLPHAGSWSRKHEIKVNAYYATMHLIDYRLSNNPSIKSQVKAICHY